MRKKRQDRIRIGERFKKRHAAIFEEGEMGPSAKEFRQPPECRKGNYTYSPLGPQKGTQLYLHLGVFSPVRLMLDFWPVA